MRKQITQQNILGDESVMALDSKEVTSLNGRNLAHILMQKFSSNLAVALFVYGEDRHAFYEYLLAELTQIKLERIQSGYLNKAEYARCAEIMRYLSKSPLYIDDFAALGANEINKRIGRLSQELTRQGIKLGLIAFWISDDENVNIQKKDIIQTELNKVSLKWNLPVVVKKAH